MTVFNGNDTNSFDTNSFDTHGTGGVSSSKAKVQSVSDATVLEGGQAVFSIGLSNTNGTKVYLDLFGGTAAAGTDFSNTMEASFDGGTTWSAINSDGSVTIGAGIGGFQI
jgi:hypothetical protein